MKTETKQARYYHNHKKEIDIARKADREIWKERGLCAKCGSSVPDGQKVRLCKRHYDAYLVKLVNDKEARRLWRDNTCMGGRKQTTGQPWKGKHQIVAKEEEVDADFI